MTTIKKSVNKKSTTIKTVSNGEFLGAVKRLNPGKAVVNAKFGVVKCTQSAKENPSGHKMYSVSKSKVAPNRGAYTYDGIAARFGKAKH